MTLQRHHVPLQRRHKRWGLTPAAFRRPLAAVALTVLAATWPTRAAAMSVQAQVYSAYTTLNALCQLPFHLEPNTTVHAVATFGCLGTMSMMGVATFWAVVPVTTITTLALLMPAVGVGVGELGTQAWEGSLRDGLYLGVQLAALYPSEYIADSADFFGAESLLRPWHRLSANVLLHRNADAYWMAWSSHLHNALVYLWPQEDDAFITADAHWRGAAPAHVGAVVRTGCAVGMSLAFPAASLRPGSSIPCIGVFLGARMATRRWLDGPAGNQTERAWWGEDGIKTGWHTALFFTLGLTPWIPNSAMVPWLSVPDSVGEHAELVAYYRSTNVNLREGMKARWRHQVNGGNYIEAVNHIAREGLRADITHFVGGGAPLAIEAPGAVHMHGFPLP
jgi:hypothetical protein